MSLLWTTLAWFTCIVTYFLLTFPLKWPRITLFLPLLYIIAGLLLEDSQCHLMKPIKKCLCPSFTAQFLLSHNIISHKITRLFSHNAFLTRSTLTYMVSLPYHWFAALYQRSANILVKGQVINILGFVGHAFSLTQHKSAIISQNQS